MKHQAEIVLQREMSFARELVWMAMTVPEHQNQWWGPDGFKNDHTVALQLQKPLKLCASSKSA